MKDIGDKHTINSLKKMFLGYPQSTLGIDEVLFLNTIDGIASAKYIARKEMCHSGGIVQGGFITGWIDAIMALACMAKCGPDVLVLTLEIKISFLNSAKVGEIISTAKVIKNTKSIAFMEGKLEDSNGSLVATGTCTAKLKHNFYNI
ncbi:MAG: hypothetical protein CFH33_01376 [Alphaproteobacteria bacterium MarineAlpha9_Bin3]|nr:MAG: hypothetical protein CFH33_01376 [Alphaproteobacteria bacterium MarineAlpha9_Bin3]|tara:strand:- start:5124 stop:5564 length:441 start_codon:yes stop_codon:yes gene_type:complete